MHSTYVFLRPTMFVVICYLVAVPACYLLSTQSPESDNDAEAIDTVAASVASLIHPDPSFTPEDVVRIQLCGLSDDNRAHGVMQCMHFASPDNRAVTGPLERFGKMVRNHEFRCLSAPDRFLIGSSHIVKGNARVLVTLINTQQFSSFVWVLSKQTAPPYEGCWMTDAVFPLHHGIAQVSNDTEI